MDAILDKLLTSDNSLYLLIGVFIFFLPKIWAFSKVKFTEILNLTSENAKLKAQNDIYVKEIDELKLEIKHLKREA